MGLLQVFIKLGQFTASLEPPVKFLPLSWGGLGQQLRVLLCQSDASWAEMSIFTND